MNLWQEEVRKMKKKSVVLGTFHREMKNGSTQIFYRITKKFGVIKHEKYFIGALPLNIPRGVL